MSRKINIQCYQCDTVYALEPDMIGETVECAVCGVVFVIPDFDPNSESDVVETNSHMEFPDKEQTPGEESKAPVIEHEPPPTYTSKKTSTHSKKLSSSTIKLDKIGGAYGMIPLVDDRFGIETSHNPKHNEKQEKILEKIKNAQEKSSKKSP